MRTWTSEAVGRATITANSGEGLYTVEADYGVTEVNQQVAALQAEAAALQSAVDELTPKIAAAESERVSKQLALNVAISALTGDDPDDSTAQSAVDKATQEVLQALAKKEVLESQLNRASARIATIEGKVELLQGLPLTATKAAWCVDYTDDATGQVRTIEINGEQPQLLIAPMAPAPDGSEGLMTHRLAMSPAATFVNAAILPGWQKFAPTYRVGEITAIDYDAETCDVDLDAALSSAQDLDINQASSLSAVPIEYMTCNADVFEVGDRVVVRFDDQDWEQPKVIGFESNPKECIFDVFVSARYTGESSFRVRTLRLNTGLTSIETHGDWFMSGLAARGDMLSRDEGWLAYTSQPGGSTNQSIVDSKNGQQRFQFPAILPPEISNYAIGVAVDKPAGLFYAVRDKYFEAYNLDNNQLLAQVSRGPVLANERTGPFDIAASKGVVCGSYIFSRDNVPPGPDERLFVTRMDPNTLAEIWTTELLPAVNFSTTAISEGFVSVTPSYAVSVVASWPKQPVVTPADISTYVIVLDMDDGSLVRQSAFSGVVTGTTSVPGAHTIRGDFLYFVQQTLNGNGVPYRIQRMIRFNFLTGSPADPDAVSELLFDDVTTTPAGSGIVPFAVY